jgi:hypothetical protein
MEQKAEAGMTVNSFKQALLATAIAGLAGSFAAVPAVAADEAQAKAEQDPAKESFKAQGIRVGTLKLFPRVQVEEVHNDNIFKEQNGAKGDWITKVTPNLSLRSDWNRHSLRLDAKTEVGRYSDKSDNDYEDYDLRARGRMDGSKALTISGDIRTRHQHEDRGDDDVATTAKNPVEYDRRDGELNVKYKPNRFGVTVKGRINDYDYDDNVNINGTTTNNDDRDRQDLIGELRLGYEVQAGYEAYVRGIYNERDYDAQVDDAGVNRDSDGYNVQAGLAVDLTRLVRADVAVGYMSQDYTATTLKDPSGFSADANIRWSLTELTALRFTASRTVNETTTANVSSTVGTNFGLGLDHEFLRNLTASADVKYANSEQQGGTRDDDTLTFSVKMDYSLNRNVFLGAKYKWEERDSNQNANDYKQQQVMLRVGAQY